MIEQSQKQKDAEERALNWQAMSPKEQLKSLDSRLGKGIGATKQRAKIEKLIRNSN